MSTSEKLFPPQRQVVVSSSNNRESFHTARCQTIRTKDASKRQLMSFRDADGFFELNHCTHCQDKDILPEEELEDLVDARHQGWYGNTDE